MITLLACSGHAAVDSLLFGGPIVGVIGWIKFDSWRRRNDPEPGLEGDAPVSRWAPQLGPTTPPSDGTPGF